jgi:hypothetical protein
MIILEFWFILFLILFIAIGIFASELESFAVGAVVYLASLTILQWIFEVPVWQSILANPLAVILYLVLFVTAGAVFTLIWMWPEFIRESASKLNHRYVDFIKRYPTGTKEEFLDSEYYPFNVYEYKQTIATWILTWPFALTWELLRKPTKYTYTLLYNALSTSFETIGRRTATKALKK